MLGLGIGLTHGAAAVGAAPEMIALETPSNTIVSGSVTYTLNQTVDYFLVDGWPVVIDPGGLTIVSRSPAATTVSTDAVNGTMKNPARLTSAVPTASQGWDQRMQGSSYSAGLNASFPISVASGDVVVGAVHEPSPSAFSGITAPVREYCPIYFTNARKPVGSVLPSAVTWTGRSGLTWRHFDAAAVIASWGAAAQRSTSGMTLPTYATVLGILARFEISWGRNYSASNGGYESETTYRGAATYGVDQARWVGAAGLYLISDAITDEQKATLLRHLVRLGLHAWEPAAGQGDAPVKGNGGHWQFDFIPKVLALHCLGLSSDLDNLHTDHPGNVLTQAFVHTSGTIADLAPHSSATKPYPYLLRTISAVSGTTITVPAGAGDPAQVQFSTLRIKRQSDGASAIVTATVNNGSTYDLTIDVQPGSPFAVGNTIYCESVDPIRVGDADWQISGDAWWSHYNPSKNASYRNLAYWTEEVLVPRALGIWRSAWDAAEYLVVRANRANDPSSTNDFDSHYTTVDGVEFARQMWNTHAAAILTGKPQFLALPTISGTGEVGSTLTATIGTMAGNATITYGSYQWYADGVAISGATSSTYTPVSGDLGKVITFKVTAANGAGSTTAYATVGTTVITSFAANGVFFPSGTSIAYTSMPTVAAGKKMTGVFFLRKPTAWWAAGNNIIDLKTAAGTTKVRVSSATTGRLTFSCADTTGSHTLANNTLAADTTPTGAYYRIGISVSTVAGARRAQFRYDNTVLTMSSFAALADDLNLYPDLGRWSVGSAGADVDLAEVWWTFNEALDLSDSAVWAKFAAGTSRGTSGEIPTGNSPALYLSGDASTFHQNKGSGGGGTVSGGPLTNSAYDPA